jgi:hypothetical protein
MSNHKIKKYQPNQSALIHLWCNGAEIEMTCPASVHTAVCGETTSLYSYSTRIAMRKEMKGQACFAVSSHQYSVTTSKHQGRIHRSIPLPFNLSHYDFSETFDSFEKAEQFRLWERRFSERLQDKQLSLVFTAPSRSVGFDANFYGEMVKEVQRQIDELANPRVSRYSRNTVWEVYNEYLKAELFRKKFCKGHKKESVKNIRQIIAAYLERIEKKEAKQAAAAAEYQKKVERIATLYAEDIKTAWEDMCRTLIEEQDAWRNYKTHDGFFEKRQQLVGTIKANICNVQGVEYHHLMSAWEDQQGIDSREGFKVRTLLRYDAKAKEIESNRGARLPETLCRALWKRHGGKVQDAEKGLPVEGLPIAVGHFNWTGVGDGNLTIGCHTIPASEVIALAARLEW